MPFDLSEWRLSGFCCCSVRRVWENRQSVFQCAVWFSVSPDHQNHPDALWGVCESASLPSRFACVHRARRAAGSVPQVRPQTLASISTSAEGSDPLFDQRTRPRHSRDIARVNVGSRSGNVVTFQLRPAHGAGWAQVTESQKRLIHKMTAPTAPTAPYIAPYAGPQSLDIGRRGGAGALSKPGALRPRLRPA